MVGCSLEGDGSKFYLTHSSYLPHKGGFPSRIWFLTIVEPWLLLGEAWGGGLVVETNPLLSFLLIISIASHKTKRGLTYYKTQNIQAIQ